MLELRRSDLVHGLERFFEAVHVHDHRLRPLDRVLLLRRQRALRLAGRLPGRRRRMRPASAAARCQRDGHCERGARDNFPDQICQAPSWISGTRRPRASKPVASSLGPPIITSRWIAELLTLRAELSARVPPKPLPNAMWAAAFSSSSVL